VQLVRHRIWKPTAAEPLDIEATVEAEIRELHAQYRVRQVLCDPYQMHRSIATLRGAGIPIEEFPQTTANTTLMGQTLLELLRGTNLTLYADDELRGQALNTVAVETPRGWRIAKEKASRKIDAIVALAMACVSAVGAPVAEPVRIWGGHLSEPAPPTDEERERVEQARRERSAKAVADAVARTGTYWP
jgi:phage terminase large subunit-like protein